MPPGRSTRGRGINVATDLRGTQPSPALLPSAARPRPRAGDAADRGRMLLSCPDRPGIVAAVAQFLFAQGANIVRSDQHTTDPHGGTFFMRLEFDLPGP